MKPSHVQETYRMFLRKTVKLSTIAMLVSATTFLNGCSSSAGGGGGSAVSFSGTLSSRLRSLARDFELQTGTASSVSCSTADNPPTVVSGSVGGDGTFSVDLSSVSGSGLTCSVLDSGNGVLGTFLYENSNEKSFGGGSQKVDTVAFSESKDVGTVSVSGGQITVDATSVGVSTTGASVTAAEAFDPTGLWSIGAVDFALPLAISVLVLPEPLTAMVLKQEKASTSKELWAKNSLPIQPAKQLRMRALLHQAEPVMELQELTMRSF